MPVLRYKTYLTNTEDEVWVVKYDDHLAEMKAFVAAVVCRYRVGLRVPGEVLALDCKLLLQPQKGSGNLVFERLPGT